MDQDVFGSDWRGTCPLWANWHGIEGVPCNETSLTNEGMVVVSDCFRSGGAYQVHLDVLPYIDDIDNSGSAHSSKKVVSYLIEQRILGVKIPIISESVVKDLRDLQSLPVDVRALRLLRFFVKHTPMVGRPVVVSAQDTSKYGAFAKYGALAWSESTRHEELVFLVEYLQKQGYALAEFFPNIIEALVTVEGFLRVSEETVRPKVSQAFIAMWFDDAMEDAYDQGIRIGVNEAGYRPLRIDRKQDVNKIDDEIITEIRRSQFIVADMTHGEDGVRGSVYYEAGFAHGLGLPVIYSCRSDQANHLQFDTRQYYHIIWADPPQLARELKARIGALIGAGPLAGRSLGDE